jgi:hypothetical protein
MEQIRTGLQLRFALCGERCRAVEARFASDAHTMPSSPRMAYLHQETTVQSRISAARAPRISHGEHVMWQASISRATV